jgi:Ca2+-binding EF-hand superfamily protein
MAVKEIGSSSTSPPDFQVKSQKRFEKFDSDSDGKLTISELESAKSDIVSTGRSSAKLDKLIQNFSELDKDQSGGLEISEFRSRPRKATSESTSPPIEESTSEAPAVQGESSDEELKQLLAIFSSSGIKGSANVYKSSNSKDVDIFSKFSSEAFLALDPNTAISAVTGSIFSSDQSAGIDTLDKVVQSSSVIQSDPYGAAKQTLQRYGLK